MKTLSQMTREHTGTIKLKSPGGATNSLNKALFGVGPLTIIFNYVWGDIYRIGQVIFMCCFFANSCFVLNVCKVVMFRVLWLCIFEFGIKF